MTQTPDPARWNRPARWKRPAGQNRPGRQGRPGAPGRVAWLATGLAVAAGAALVVVSAAVPLYDSATISSDSPAVTTTTSTLVEVNGAQVLWVVGAPLGAALLVAACLARGGRAARGLAWTATGVVAAIAVVGLASIGLLVAPVAAALVVALVTSRRRSTAVPGAWGPGGQH